MNSKQKTILASGFATAFVAAALLAGCISLAPQSSASYVNGWDSVTHHLDVYNTVEGVGLGAAGFDVWPYGLTYDCGYEDVGDRSAAGPLVGGIPADYATLDGIIAGDIGADAFADAMLPVILGKMKADPAFDAKLASLVGNVRALDDADYEKAKALAMDRYGVDLDTVTAANAEEYLRVILETNLVEHAFPALSRSLEPMRENGLTFQAHSLNPVTTLAGVSALAEGLDARDPVALDLIEDGKLTLAELEGITDDSHKLNIQCLGIGLVYVYTDFIYAGEHEYVWYKQIAAPLPGTLKTERLTVDANWGVQYSKHIVLDEPALLLSGPSLKMPLVGAYSTGQDVDFAMLALNLGWEGGEATITERMPWGDESSTLAFGPGLSENEDGVIEIALEVVHNPVRIPAQETWTVATTSTSLVVIDDDTGKEGLKNDPAPGRHVWRSNAYFDALGLGFSAASVNLFKPLDVVLVAEPTTGGAPQVPDAPLPPEGEDARAFLDQASANLAEQVEFTLGQVRAELEQNGVPVPPTPGVGDAVDDLVDQAGADVAVDSDTSGTETWARAAWGPGIRFHSVATIFDLADYLNGLDLTPAEGDATGLSAFRDFPNTVVILGANGANMYQSPGADAFMATLNDVGIGIVEDADAYAAAPFVRGAGFFVGATTPDQLAVNDPGANGNGVKDVTNAAPIATYKGTSLIVPSDFALPAGDAIAAFNEGQTGFLLGESHSHAGMKDAAANGDLVLESVKDTLVGAAAKLVNGGDAFGELETGADAARANAETAGGNLGARAEPATLAAGHPAVGGTAVGSFIPLDEDDPTLGTGWLVGFELAGQSVLIGPDLQTAAAGDNAWYDASGRIVANAGFSLSGGVFFVDPTPM